MALVIPDGYAQLTYCFTGPSLVNPAATTIGVKLDVDKTLTELAVIAQAAWSGDMDGFYTGTTTVNVVKVKKGPNDLGPSGDFAANMPGSADGEPMPGNVSSLVQKRTALGGRRNRGRMFIPGVSEASIDGNSRWDAGELTARQSDCDAFLAALAADDCLACVFHDESLGAVTPTLITSLQVQSLLATQRRRLRR